MMLLRFWILLVILCIGMFISVRTGKLTIAGALTGGLLGFFIFLGAGYVGISMIGVFFILGTAATSWRISWKISQKVAEQDKGKRTAGQVFANAGVAGISGLLTLAYPEGVHILRLMMAAALASATADTLSSELGNVYGRNYYNIITFQKEKRGPDGVVSWEGTLFGVAGSALIALIYILGFGWSTAFLWIVLAGTIGMMADSIIGATLERRHLLNNNAVNFLNTLIAACVGALLYFFFEMPGI